MKLYYSDVLSAQKACAAAKYLKSPVEYVYLDLVKGEQKSPAYLAINPNGKVPTLVDATRIIWEADAVMCELAAQAGSSLWPNDARQIDILRWLSWSAQHFTRQAGALYFEYIIKPRFGLGAPDQAAVDAALVEFRKFAAVLDGHLQGRRWLVGDEMTVADFSVAVTLSHAERAHIPLNEFSDVRRWHDRLNELEAWRTPFPERA